jgi:hypothetical protein
MKAPDTFRTIAEYENFIFDLRSEKILEKMDQKIALNLFYGPLDQPSEDIRCDCPLCKELWS